MKGLQENVETENDFLKLYQERLNEMREELAKETQRCSDLEIEFEELMEERHIEQTV